MTAKSQKRIKDLEAEVAEIAIDFARGDRSEAKRKLRLGSKAEVATRTMLLALHYADQLPPDAARKTLAEIAGSLCYASHSVAQAF